jgi:hypothetical protein
MRILPDPYPEPEHCSYLLANIGKPQCVTQRKGRFNHDCVAVVDGSVVDPDHVKSLTFWLGRIRNNCAGSGSDLFDEKISTICALFLLNDPICL